MISLFLLIFLIALNGLLAMAEIAVSASRSARLQELAQADPRVGLVTHFRANPSRLLATTQLGLTALAMLSGIVGESAWIEQITGHLTEIMPKQVAYPLALTVVITVISFFTIVFGEVIPKRIALANPEKTALALAPLLTRWMKMSAILVTGISFLADSILKIFNLKAEEQTRSEEILMLINAGKKEGNLDKTEGMLLGNVFRLDNRRVKAIMTPSSDLVCLDRKDTSQANIQKMLDSSFSRFVVIDGSFENICGIAETRKLFSSALNSNLDLSNVDSPIYVPGSLSLLGLLEFFESNRTQIALVINEFGAVEGLVTVADLLGAVIGDTVAGTADYALIAQRDDGSWLCDGLLPLDEMAERLGIVFPEETKGECHTVGGFVLYEMGRIPRKAESFEFAGWRFEVVDMDKNRVDEILAKKLDIPS